ncbi:LysR family transcriptional regulator [Paludibacterium paludis]|uniref:LysR family transcriptional regulator n=1 Tax=Paludibacterium paludis TaxID=1225769 RepID=A0A918NXN7_9NEIS|nr:LysR family transcriptional regulator [Paludibacterium paludis]GGY03205.1 LysR family transcriptional regulator [Paludibacterium paludis]
MDIRGLRYFVEAVRAKSFTRAAENLYVTQPTISKMMKQLEEDLGVPLFIREGKQFRLTDAGQLVYRRSEDVLLAMARLKSELADLAELEHGELVVGLPPMIGGAFYAPVVRAFRERYPGIELKLVEDGALAIESSIRDGSLEVGVAVLPVDRDTFDHIGFVKDTLRLIVPAGSRWAGRARVKLADIADEPMVCYPKDFTLSSRIEDGFRRLGKTVNVAGRSAHWDFIVAMVEARLGIALLPSTIAARIAGRPLEAIELDEAQIVWHLGLIWKKDSYLSHAARAWIALSRTMLGTAP